MSVVQPPWLSAFLRKDTAGNIFARDFSSGCREENLVQSSRLQDSESAPEGTKYN